MNVLLVNPVERIDAFPWTMPVGLGSVGTVIAKQGHKMSIFDLNAFRSSNNETEVLNITSGKSDGIAEPVDWDMIYLNVTATNYPEAKRLVAMLNKFYPTAVMVLDGPLVQTWPAVCLKHFPAADVAVHDDGEVVVSDILEKIPGQRWSGIKGIAYRDGKAAVVNPREPMKELDEFPLPDFHYLAMSEYLKYSAIQLGVPESMASRRRVNFSWERRRWEDGKMVVRFPSPERCVENMYDARVKYATDFSFLVDPDIGLDHNWLLKFLKAYIESGLNELMTFGMWAKTAPVAMSTEVNRSLKDANCRLLLFDTERFRAAEWLGLQKAVDMCQKNGLATNLRVRIAQPDQGIDEVIGIARFLRDNKFDPFEVAWENVLPGSLYYEESWKEVVEHFGGKAKGDFDAALSDEPKTPWWSLSKKFDPWDLLAMMTMLKAADVDGLLRMAHARGWAHDPKWNCGEDHGKKEAA